MTPKLIQAAIPIVDWNGPSFLAFYVIAYVLAVAFTLYLGRLRMNRFNAVGLPAEPDDPYEIAYLAGGLPRAIKLAVGRLIRLELVTWSRHWYGDRLAPRPGGQYGELHPLEAEIYARILKSGEKGLPVRELAFGCAFTMAGTERRLASAGLRPTARELHESVLPCLWPLPLLLVAGFIKMFIGISRHRPVGFLMIAMGVTFVSIFVMAMIISKRGSRVTPAGRDVLGQLQARHSSGPHEADPMNLNAWSLGLALAGTCAMTGIPNFDSSFAAMERHSVFSRTAATGSSGCGSSGCSAGSGCSGGSGCGGGSSGCGGSSCGSGCGGCGGGGGD